METPVPFYSNLHAESVNPPQTSPDASLDPVFQTLSHLSPSSQDLVISLVNQLGQREGISVDSTGTRGLKVPADGIDLWVIHLKRKRQSKRTIESYVSVVSAYLARDPLPTRLNIERYLADELDRVSPARVKTIRNGLRSFFGFLHSSGLWPTNPVAQVEGIPVPKHEKRVPEDHEIAALLQQRVDRGKGKTRTFRPADDAKFRLITILLIDTGLRREECATIKKADIDYAAGFIRVLGKGTGGGKERFVPISPETAQLLGAYVEQFTFTDNPYLFPASRKGVGHAWINNYAKTLKRMCKNAGIPPISPHQLRHYFATSSMRDGARLHIISRILGHASVAITADVYTHVNRDEMSGEHARHSPLAKHIKPMLPAGDREEKRTA